MSKISELVLKALRKMKDKLSDDDLEKVEDAIDGIEFPSEVSDDERVISNKEYRGLKDDLTGLRKKKRELQEEIDDLKETAEKGGDDDDSKKAVEKLKKIEPLLAKVIKSERARLETLLKELTEKARDSLDLPKKLKDAEDDEVLAAVEQIDKWVELGMVKIEADDDDPDPDADADKDKPGDDDPPNHPKVPGATRKKARKLTDKERATMDPAQMMDVGYGDPPPKQDD